MDESSIQETPLEGVMLPGMAEGTKVNVRTLNNDYEITLSGLPDRIKVTGGRFNQQTELYFHGSTSGGTSIRWGWIGKGMKMEFGTIEGKIIQTSRVVSISLRG